MSLLPNPIHLPVSVTLSPWQVRRIGGWFPCLSSRPVACTGFMLLLSQVNINSVTSDITDYYLTVLEVKVPNGAKSWCVPDAQSKDTLL